MTTKTVTIHICDMCCKEIGDFKGEIIACQYNVSRRALGNDCYRYPQSTRKQFCETCWNVVDQQWHMWFDNHIKEEMIK